ncbi:MAG: SIMPL domain-containing protein [Tranquillimonas sp.]
MRRILTAALAALTLTGAPALAQQAHDPEAGAAAPGRIVVNGEGRVARSPDMAVLQLGVTERAEAAADAVDLTSRAMEAILAALSEAGIDAADMQTSQLRLYPVREGPAPDGTIPRVTRFEASNRLQVRVRDLSRLGAILDLVVSSGSNSFDGLNFDLQDPQPARDAAREAAVADGARKARLLAQAAGVALGPLVGLSEGGGQGPGPMPMMREARAVPVAEGEVEFTEIVTMEYAIGR